MTEDKFSELVNLYLDQEISAEDLELLKAELADNSERKVEFQERCRLHQAMRLAMGGASNRSSSGRRSSGSSSRRKNSGSSSRASRGQASSSKRSSAATSTSRSTKIDEASPKVVPFPRWIPGLAFVACMAVGYMVLSPFIKEAVHVSKYTLKSAYKAVDQGKVEEAVDPLDAVDSSHLKRFASNQQRNARRSSSLAAELRLLGLHPEVMEQDAALSEVSMASIQPRDVSQRRVEMLNQLKEYSPIPDADILETSEPRAKRSTVWPAGFQTSLASFK